MTDTTIPQIALKNCSVRDKTNTYIQSLSWEMTAGENWLVTGPNGGGKSTIAEALAGSIDIVPFGDGFYSNTFKSSTVLVSFETAAALIEEERRRDDSDYIEGGVDPGRTPRKLLAEIFSGKIEEHPAVTMCGIESVLDRGLKYLSTGEIRRTLLCRALISNPGLIILDEPFGGLDITSRERLSALITKMLSATALSDSHTDTTAFCSSKVLLVMDRVNYVPEGVTHVLELANKQVTFSGKKDSYLARVEKQKETNTDKKEEEKNSINKTFLDAQTQGSLTLAESIRTQEEILVKMNKVTVSWSDHVVLDNLSWTLHKGEHWLIRGPNGSGKTTFLELITGDNPQIFCNDVWIFGKKRGTGETIWELKEKMGIVSYRLHVEYRALGNLSLETVILSGLHDSIGLYQQCGEQEQDLAKKWLALAGLEGRESEQFRDLSYGEQRAILIARAAIKCPPLLILDEPCHGLDDTYRERILKLLQLIAESGTSTLLHVTHDPTEVLPCEKNILELRPGEKPMYRILQA
jgi:molybdate transport system ATP-binding protein